MTTDQLSATSPGRAPISEPVRRDWRRALTSENGARLTSYVIGILFWVALATVFERVPGPIVVGQRLVDEYRGGQIINNFLTTTYRFGIGVTVTVLISLVIGVMMGLSSLARSFFESPVLVGLSIPGIIWAFLTVMWFGFGWEAPIVTIVLTAFPFVTVNIAKGVAGVPRDLRDMSRSYGVPMAKRMRHLVLPAVTGYIVSGVRFGVIIGWNAVLLSEWFGGTAGVGFRSRFWYDKQSFDGFVAWVLLFLAFILILDRWVMEPMARRAFAWRDA